jgi:hypothetical protein
MQERKNVIEENVPQEQAVPDLRGLRVQDGLDILMQRQEYFKLRRG